MIKLTLGQARSQVAAVCGDTGIPSTHALVAQYVNSAVEELMNEGEWPNVVDRWHIVNEDGEITLPSHLDRLMQINISGVPQTIASPWFQFVAYGPGTPDDRCNCGTTWAEFDGGWMIEDRGEFPTRVSLPEDGADGPWVLRIYPAVQEAEGAYCTIQGLNADGLVIRSEISDGSGGEQWITGIQMSLSDGTGYVESSQEFSEITAFTKPETNGYIRITAWNGTDEIELSNYEYWETNPSYHRYFSRWLNNLNAGAAECLRFVRARCRKRFKEVSEDTDELIIGNLPALKEMVIAQWKRQADDYDGYAVHKSAAVDLMKKEAAGYRGKARLPSLTIQRGFGIGSSLPALR